MFEYFLELPKNVRMVVNDEMRPDDRCRFTRCSKLCNEEARASKNYVYGLEVVCWADSYIRITISHENYQPDVDNRQGFCIYFREDLGRKYKEYYSLVHNETSCKIELDNSTDLVQSAINEFREKMKIYQHSVKKLVVNGVTIASDIDLLKDANFGIESLNNLEQLDVYGDIDALQFLSKLRKPLKRLYFAREQDSQLLLECEQVHQTEKLICWRTEFSMEQLLQLSSKVVTMSIERQTEKDIFEFIRWWQNGKIEKDFEVYRWGLRGSNFSMQKLSRLLRSRIEENEFIEIKHFNKAGKSAFLRFDHFRLEFNAGLAESI